MYYMNKYHKFEYNRISTNLYKYFIIDIFSYGVMIWMFTFERLIDEAFANKSLAISFFLKGAYMLNVP